MNVFKFFGFLVVMLIILSLFVQNFGDVLCYSSFDFIGIVCFMGAGFVFGFLGVDIFVFSINLVGFVWM